MWTKLEKVKAVWIEHATVSMEGNLKLRLKMKLLTISYISLFRCMRGILSWRSKVLWCATSKLLGLKQVFENKIKNLKIMISNIHKSPLGKLYLTISKLEKVPKQDSDNPSTLLKACLCHKIQYYCNLKV